MDRQFGMADLAAFGVDQAVAFLGTERALVEFDRRRAVIHSQRG